MLLLLLATALAADRLALDGVAMDWGDTGGPDDEGPGAARDITPPGWVVEAARVEVSVRGDADADVAIEYRFRRLTATWQKARLIGPELVVTAVDGPVTAGPGGVFAVLPPEGSVTTVRVRGALRAAKGAATLRLLPGARAAVSVTAPGYDVDMVGAIGGVTTAEGDVTVRWRPHVERAPQRPAAVVLGEASVAGWESEGALQVQAKVRWRVARGELPTLRLTVGELDELDVTGAVVGGWKRQGREVVITPVGPVSGLAEVLVRGRLPLPKDGAVDLPAVGPADARRVERYWTLGRPEEIDAIPTSAARLTSPRALPAWARGLSEAPPVAAWQGDGPVHLKLARYEPLMGPDTVVESAEFVLSTSAEGRELLRSTWLVRNERSQYLHVRPSEGYRPLTARVSGDPVTVLADGEGGLYVPLEKSVETMQGLVSFPVEVTWIGERPGWERAGERAFVLPAVDAPIQAATWSVHLPRDIEERLPRARGRPGHATGTLGMSGFGAGGGGMGKDVSDIVEVPQVDQRSQDIGREAWLNALDAYKNNEFDDAAGWLDVARSYVPEDSNVQRLQSNLDVLLQESGPSGSDDAQARRIRDLANAKTVAQQVEVEDAERKAEEALRSGDEATAEQYYQKVVEIAEKVAVTEQKESTEQQGKADKAKKALSSLEAKRAREAPPPPPPAPPPTTSTTTSPGAYGWGSGGDEIADGFDANEVGGIEGGVEGGVVGGVLGGQVAGAGSTRMPVVDAEPAPELEALGYASPSAAIVPESSAKAIVFDDRRDGAGAPPADEDDDRAENTGETLSADFLSRIPAGRTYQSSVQTAAGKSGRGGRSGAKASGGEVRETLAGASSVTNAPAQPTAAKPAVTKGAAIKYPPRAEVEYEQQSVLPVLQDNDGDAILDELDRMEDLPSPDTGATANPTGRRALEVSASPFTPALPLDGALVTHDSALLPAGAFPSFTVPYRTRGN